VTQVPIRRALVSVYDKTGIADLALALSQAGIEIVSTGSTAAVISAAGVAVTRVEQVTGFPECLDGRVKTLHPGVHAGLLADLGQPGHRAQLAELRIEPFELLVSNLYPFEQAVAGGAGPAECVEQIDIGGPAMVRAAAKNHAWVAVCTDPSAYPEVAAAVVGGGFTLDQRRRLAARAFAHTASYDAAIASWFAAVYAPDETAQQTGWPEVITAAWSRKETLRYGENPHQRAALYVRAGSANGSASASGAGGVAAAEQLQGKAMSYNNYVDADAARRAVFDFAEPCVSIMKHSNPCGIAIGTDLADAHRRANDCDPVSAYGGVIAANGEVTAALAEQIAGIFTEVLIAPGFEPAALDILARRKNLRVLRCAAPAPTPAPAAEAGAAATASGAAAATASGAAAAIEWRQLSGGLLLQTADLVDQAGDLARNWRLAAGPAAPGDVLRDLAFAWRACRAVKSNAILLAAGEATVGIGMGQVNRVDSARLAVTRAGDRARGAVAASDAFFPFADGLQVLADAGVRAVAEPGGSIHDDEVIAAADAAGLALYFTGVRHFFH
jgi:phosphoribosylaminoimidazolecarboxamide formyltransferase/IMP cyclohydrolase